MVLNTRDSDSTQSELPEEAKNRVLQTLGTPQSVHFCKRTVALLAAHILTLLANSFCYLPNLTEQMNVNLEEFLAHVSTLLEKKEHITNYLQTPFSSDYLLVEAEHQSNFLQLFRDVSQFILGLPTTISAIEWAANLHIGESQLDRKLWSLCALLAKCQRYHDAVNQWSELYRELL